MRTLPKFMNRRDLVKNYNIRPSYDANRQVLGNILPLDTPFTVIIDSSETCNFKCNYCFRSDKNKENWGYAKEPLLMQWDMFKQIADQIKAFPQKVKTISLSNHGEPLCNPTLPEMVKYLKDHQVCERVSIHTNGSLLSEIMVKKLAESGIDKVVISLQGLTAEKYREICGTEIDYEKLVRQITNLFNQKKNTKLFIKIADTALDDNQEQQFYERFSPIADGVYIEKIVPIWKNISIINKKMQNKYGKTFPVQHCCPLIFHTLIISPVGDIFPCTQLLTPHCLGNVAQTTVVDAWNSQQRLNLLIEQCENTQPTLCTDCYILQNTIISEADMIDEYRHNIMSRLKLKYSKI